MFLSIYSLISFECSKTVSAIIYYSESISWFSTIHSQWNAVLCYSCLREFRKIKWLRKLSACKYLKVQFYRCFFILRQKHSHHTHLRWWNIQYMVYSSSYSYIVHSKSLWFNYVLIIWMQTLECRNDSNNLFVVYVCFRCFYFIFIANETGTHICFFLSENLSIECVSTHKMEFISLLFQLFLLFILF